MAKIRHIAITAENPPEVAAFYMAAFDMQEVTRNERQVLLSDGYINLTILIPKTEQDSDLGPDGLNYSGIHHSGLGMSLGGVKSINLSAYLHLPYSAVPSGPWSPGGITSYIAKIRHIAITAENPPEVAAFYMAAFESC